jgi:hypothetical protein
MRLVHVLINVETARGELQYATDFGPGLNVLSAPNSFGKSTLLQSIVYALGLEGMFSASRTVPVGPVLSTVADFPDGTRAPVLRSSITLEVANDRGGYLRTQRFVVGEGDNSLVRTWQAGSREGLDAAPQVDMFVRQPGAATRELGFHTELSRFLGWTLPTVAAFGGGEVPLYLEALFPLFVVEQKAGWSGITPRMPTYLRIRDVLPRSVEYILGLESLQRRRELFALRETETRIRRDWSEQGARLRGAAEGEGLRVELLDASPREPTERRRVLLSALVGDQWLPVEAARTAWSARLEVLTTVGPGSTADARTEQSRSDLAEAEQTVRQLAARRHVLDQRRDLIVADLESVTERLASVASDRQRAMDLMRLRRLGSTLEVGVVADDTCPTCAQRLDERHVATGHIASLDDTIAVLEAERQTLVAMQASASERNAELREAAANLTREQSVARQRVRILREELSGPGNAPSIVDLQERLELRDRVAAVSRVEDTAFAVDEDLDRLAGEFADTRRAILALEAQAQSDSDARAIDAFRRSFTAQLSEYGLRSLPPTEVTLDENTFVPINDGIELAFDLTMGMSASDTIRTKWAYFVGLADAASTAENGHHVGFLVLDEPRQQETDRVSVGALVRRLTQTTSRGTQVVFATSEDPEELREILAGIDFYEIQTPSNRLLGPVL